MMNDGGGFRERWDMPAWFGRPMFLFRAPVAVEDIASLEPVPPSIVIGHLEGWLLAAPTRRKLLDVLEALSSLSLQAFDSEDYEGLLGSTRTRLTRALDSGELVAYEPALASHGVLQPSVQPPSSRPKPGPTTTFYALKVVDEVGAAIAGLDLIFKLDGDPRNITTDGAGIARIDDVTATDGEAIVASVPALRKILEPRWTAPRTPKIPTGPNVVTRELDDTLDSVDLRAAAIVTLVITPYFHCFEIAGKGFDFGSSFITADALSSMASIAADLTAHASRRAMIFAHTDRTRDEAAEKQLSERRAEAVFAVYTQDADRWEELFQGARSAQVPEKWGTREIQHQLNSLGCPDGGGNRLEEDGLTGLRTSEALRRFPGGTFRGRVPVQKSLPATGIADDATRRELFLAYARKVSRKPVAADRFAQVNGSSFMGCGRYNPFTIDDSDAESRRAVVFLFDTAAEPKPLPCKIGDIAPCQAVITPPLTALGPAGEAPYRCSVYKKFAGGCPCQAGPPLVVFRLQLHDDRYDPMGRVDYRLQLPDGTVVRRQTDDEGILRYAVPSSVSRVEVTYRGRARGERFVIPVEVGAPTADSPAFYMAHLRNFGFGQLGDADNAILLRFQAACAGLELSGALDDATKKAVDDLIDNPLSGRLQGDGSA